MTTKLIIIAGFGPGISTAVAQKFGSLGYTLALLSRTQSKLDEAVAHFSKQNIPAKGFAVDLSDPHAVKSTIPIIKSAFGTGALISILFWNPYGVAKGVLDGTIEDFQSNFNLTITSLITAVQASLPDLEATKGAVLVTGGGLSLENDTVAQVAVDWNAATLAVSKAAQRKTVHLLNLTVKSKGVYAGEVTVLGAVKGTPFDSGNATITAEEVAETFVELEKKREAVFVNVA
ncbi:hypothetical protein BC829DRAFT_407018 [Chytridium lagenaria]|nr:hypothetical protein BC829DRAFT_407018 [Chytridium lagenaria]